MDKSEDLNELKRILTQGNKRSKITSRCLTGSILICIVIVGVSLAVPFASRSTPSPVYPLLSGRSQVVDTGVAPTKNTYRKNSRQPPPFVPPSLQAAPSMSVIDAARMVDKAKTASDRSDTSETMPTLQVDKVITVRQAASVSLGLSVSARGVLPEHSSITVVGLPDGVTLSAGQRSVAGTWRLVPDDLGELKLTASSKSEGASELSIRLAAPDGRVVYESRSKLIVIANPALSNESHSAPAFTDAEDIKTLMSHGRDLQRVGYIAGARLFYKRAADSGSAEGARAMGDTYDPAVLAKLGVRGLEPDPEIASRWRAKAKTLERSSSRATTQP